MQTFAGMRGVGVKYGGKFADILYGRSLGLNRKLAQVSIWFSQYLLFEIALFGLFGHKMERK